jgi:hypothetical protein
VKKLDDLKKLLQAAVLGVALAFSSPTLGALAQEAGGESPVPQVPAVGGGQTLYLPLVFRRAPSITVFGAESRYLTANYGLNHLVASNPDWVRRAGIWWPDVEPQKGQYNWDAINRYMLDAQVASANGIHLILIVRGTPSWAQKIRDSECGPIAQGNFADFGNFMYELVSRYSRPPYNVKFWEIGNEPDIAYDFPGLSNDQLWGCWGDSRDPYYGGGYYAEMLKVVYPRIKEADPAARVLNGGLLLDCDPDNPPAGKNCQSARFFEGILRAGGADYFDIVSYHAYDYYKEAIGKYSNANWASAWSTTGPVSIAKYNFLKRLMVAYGAPNKPVMNTESALLCLEYPGAVCGGNMVFENTKAYYVGQAYASAIALGLRANLWYSLLGWPGRYSGLLDANNNPLPAYHAFVAARARLNDADYLGPITAADVGDLTGVMGFKFDRGDRIVWAVWTKDANDHTLTLPRVPSGVWGVQGAALSINGQTVNLSATRMFAYIEFTP